MLRAFVLSVAACGSSASSTPQSSIATIDGEVAVSRLRVGAMVWTVDAAGRRVAAPVRRIASVPVSGPHVVLEVSLADGRVFRASPEHPIDRKPRVAGDLERGDALDGSTVARIRVVPYGDATWDLLPEGPTGMYWVDGVLVGSTLV